MNKGLRAVLGVSLAVGISAFILGKTFGEHRQSWINNIDWLLTGRIAYNCQSNIADNVRHRNILIDYGKREVSYSDFKPFKYATFRATVTPDGVSVMMFNDGKIDQSSINIAPGTVTGETGNDYYTFSIIGKDGEMYDHLTCRALGKW